MRGKEQMRGMSGIFYRITPAYAGKSGFLWYHIAIPPGSPPPMRGKVQYGRTARRPVRITPAYAGKSTGAGLDTPP